MFSERETASIERVRALLRGEADTLATEDGEGSGIVAGMWGDLARELGVYADTMAKVPGAPSRPTDDPGAAEYLLDPTNAVFRLPGDGA